MKSTVITLPTNFLEVLGTTVYICRGKNNSLQLLTPQARDELIKEIKSLAVNTSLEDLVFSGMEEVAIAPDGEIDIPAYLWNHMGPEGEIEFISKDDKLHVSRR